MKNKKADYSKWDYLQEEVDREKQSDKFKRINRIKRKKEKDK